MAALIVAIWNHLARPAHLLVVLQPRRSFFVREVGQKTAIHLEARLLGDARVFFCGSEAEARGLAGSIAAGFDEILVPAPGSAAPAAEARDGGARRRAKRRESWLGSTRRRSR